MQLFEYSFHTMGGPGLFKAWASAESEFNQWCRLVDAELSRITHKFSFFDTDSMLSKINQAAGKHAVEIDTEMYELLHLSDSLWQASEGRFDISAAPLFSLWDFKEKLVPKSAEIELTRKLIGFKKIEYSEGRCFLPHKDMAINFGGFGKEYAVDCVISLLLSAGCQHGLVNLAGDICVTGPQLDQQSWKIGIQHPRQINTAIQTVHLSQGAIATSGDYERFFIKNNQRYCHIINALTGQPIKTPAAISILAANCLTSGTFATIAMLKEDNALLWLEENHLHALIITNDMSCRWFNAG